MVFSRTTDTIQGDRTIRAVIAAKHAGYSNFEVAMDHELQFEVNRRFAVDLGVDAIQTNSIVNWMGMQKAIGWKGIMFPGIGLPEDGCTQWTEPSTEDEAFLKEDEYDEFTEDPTAFLLNKWLPRFTDHLQPHGQTVMVDTFSMPARCSWTMPIFKTSGL